ncbi:MAG TPA: adenylate/guanylate cyclase domain-containing protein [Candidatus Wallbacteria bacterium]|nr:adenylate/guanylate cyclase domain-containing protein [Candidatus Wallbacteria bacterium]
MNRDNELSAPEKLLRAEKEIRLLKQKLERSERNRAIMEDIKDNNQVLLKNVGAEIEAARLTIQQKNEELERIYKDLAAEKEKSEDLLLNILPHEIADELKATQKVEPLYFDSVTVLFTDVKGFTKISAELCVKDLIRELDSIFTRFDAITEKHGIEKIKTIGDSYMCAGGIPTPNETHAVNAVLAAIEMQKFMSELRSSRELENKPFWEIRLGMHTGPVMAGVVGKRKFAYDIWGDTVNTASRMESSGVAGRVNISQSTYLLVRDFFETEYRGKIMAKNIGEIEMYFVNGPK